MIPEDFVERAKRGLVAQSHQRVGELAVSRGWITRDDLAKHLQSEPYGRAESLVERGLLSQDQLKDLFEAVDQGAPTELGDRYEIIRRIGSGATSDIFEARDRVLGRHVALKRIHGDYVEITERSRREAEATARLSHPGIVTLHDFIERDGQFLLVMELVRGHTLTEVLREKVDFARSAAILEKVARAVHYAHERGIIHRDLKPNNILIGEDGEPKVADFGLARLVDYSDFTNDGIVLGTPFYMAPEQASGQKDAISPRTDVYALGAVLYEVLAGHPPFSDVDELRAIDLIIQVEPVAPSQLRKGVPHELETVMLTAMQKEPGARYASALEFAEELSRWQRGQPVTAQAPSPPPRVSRAIWRRLGVHMPSAAARRIARVKARGAEPARIPQRIEPLEANMREAIALLEGAHAILERVSQSFYMKGARADDGGSRLEAAEALIAQVIARLPNLASAYVLQGRVQGIRGAFDDAEDSFRDALVLDPDLATAHYQLGRLLVIRSILSIGGPRTDVPEAARELEVARAGAPTSPLQRQFVDALLAFAHGNRDEAVRQATVGTELFDGEPGVEEFHWLIGVADVRPPARLAAFERALDIRPRYPLAQLCRGVLRGAMGDVRRAMADVESAQKLSPLLVEAWYCRGVLRAQGKDAKGARADFARALELMRDDSPHRATVEERLAQSGARGS